MVAPGLLDMPEKVLKGLIENDERPIDLIVLLRKVCRQLRTSIDEHRPNPGFTQIDLVMDYEKTNLHYKWNESFSGFRNQIFRKSSENKCELMRMFRPSKVIDAELETVILADLAVYLSFQSSQLDLLNLNCSPDAQANYAVILEGLQKILQTRGDDLLKVQKLTISAKNQEDILKILPFLDEKSIKSLEISRIREENDETPFGIDKLVDLEQWKNLEELKIDGNVVEVPEGALVLG